MSCEKNYVALNEIGTDGFCRVKLDMRRCKYQLFML